MINLLSMPFSSDPSAATFSEPHRRRRGNACRNRQRTHTPASETGLISVPIHPSGSLGWFSPSAFLPCLFCARLICLGSRRTIGMAPFTRRRRTIICALESWPAEVCRPRFTSARCPSQRMRFMCIIPRCCRCSSRARSLFLAKRNGWRASSRSPRPSPACY